MFFFFINRGRCCNVYSKTALCAKIILIKSSCSISANHMNSLQVALIEKCSSDFLTFFAALLSENDKCCSKDPILCVVDLKNEAESVNWEVLLFMQYFLMEPQIWSNFFWILSLPFLSVLTSAFNLASERSLWRNILTPCFYSDGWEILFPLCSILYTDQFFSLLKWTFQNFAPFLCLDSFCYNTFPQAHC